jgi:hypothetical protein
MAWVNGLNCEMLEVTWNEHRPGGLRSGRQWSWWSLGDSVAMRVAPALSTFAGALGLLAERPVVGFPAGEAGGMVV